MVIFKFSTFKRRVLVNSFVSKVKSRESSSIMNSIDLCSYLII